MDKDRKRRDWLDAQTVVQESDTWTEPDSQVFRLSDDELGLNDPPLEDGVNTDPDGGSPVASHLPVVPPADDQPQPGAPKFVESSTAVWQDGEQTPAAPQRVRGPSVTGPHQAIAAPPLLHDNSKEHLDLLDDDDIVEELQDKPVAAEDLTSEYTEEFPDDYQAGYQDDQGQAYPDEANVGYREEAHDGYRDEALDGYHGQAHDDYQAQYSEYPEVQGPDQRLQLEAPPNVTVRNIHDLSPDPRLVVMTQPGSMAAEQYRVLSLKLREMTGRRAIAVLVPTPDVEGCVVASNVALALAEGSRSRVVLLDANLRADEVQDLFGLQSGMPLGEQIRHHRRNPDDPWEVLGLGPSFHVLVARPVQSNPSALLSSETMADLVDELRQLFDFIILSAPPVMQAADGVILQDYVDGSLLVALAGVTRQDSLRASLSRLGEGKVLGTVLLGVKETEKR